MNAAQSSVRVGLDLPLDPARAFDLFLEELATGLERTGVSLETGPNGRVLAGGGEIGRVISWAPGEKIVLRWRAADWKTDAETEVEVRVEGTDGGSRITVAHRGWGKLIDDPQELLGWFAGEAVAPLLRAMTPAGLGDWLTDRRARRPSGEQSRGMYREPLFHYPGFKVILAELALTESDYLLDVGCGGGAFLKEALRSGCRAAGVDHSAEMVRLAAAENRDAVDAGRLEVRLGSAERLPFPDATFTAASMHGVFGFLSDPVAALREVRRVLRDGGRLVVLGSDPAMRGTPAAPEPIASRLKFYQDDELARLGAEAGFTESRVVRRDMERYAREVGIPEAAMPLFTGRGAPFLLA